MSTDKLSAEQEALENAAREYALTLVDEHEGTPQFICFKAGANWHRDTVAKELEKLQEFKQYVHDRLDKMGIPADPEPENNASHGCRIEGRLNVVEKMIGNNVA